MTKNIFHLLKKNLKVSTAFKIIDLDVNIGISEDYLLEILKNKSLISMFRVIMPAIHYNYSRPWNNKSGWNTENYTES